MIKVNMHEAKSNFSKLVVKALQGEEVIFVKDDRPLVKLVPIDRKQEFDMKNYYFAEQYYR